MYPVGRNHEVVLEIEPHIMEPNRVPEQPPKIINEGLWTISATGSQIRCRGWRILDSNFRFYLDGRILLGPGTSFYWVFTIVHLIATSVVFLVFEIQPRINDGLHYKYTIPIVTTLLGVVSIVSVLQVALTEPGFIPKPSIEMRKANLLTYYINKKATEPCGLYRSLKGKRIWHTFCEPCRHFKPAGSKHCDECGGCIENFDHHCNIFGICVGKRNYIPFLRFVICTSTLFLIVGTISLTHLILHSLQSGFLDAVTKAPTILVLLLTLIVPPCGLVQVVWLVFRLMRSIIRKRRRRSNRRILVESMDVQSNENHLVLKGLRSIYVWIICPPSKSRIHPREYKDVIAIPRVAEEKEKTTRKARTIFSSIYDPDEGNCQPPPAKKPRMFSHLAERVAKFSTSCCVPSRVSGRVMPMMNDEIEPNGSGNL